MGNRWPDQGALGSPLAKGAASFYCSVARCIELVTDPNLTDLEYLRQSKLEETKGRNPLSFANNPLRYDGRSH